MQAVPRLMRTVASLSPRSIRFDPTRFAVHEVALGEVSLRVLRFLPVGIIIPFGPRRDEVTREWRKLHNEELSDLYSSPNIVRVIKSRRMRWAGHVARIGMRGGRIRSWWGNRRERDHWGDLGVDGWIILGWISRRWDVGMWTGLGWPRIGTGVGRL